VGLLLGVNALVIELLICSWLTGTSLSPLTWYLARSAGLTLYLLLWASTVLGLGMTTGLFGRFGDRALVLSLHRFTTDLAYAALAMHLFALALDSYVPFSLADLLIPFHAMNGNIWTALGVIGAWSMIIIGVSFSTRRWIGQRNWRLLHFGTFPLYLLALIHGIGSGTDTGNPWVFVGYMTTLGLVLFLTSYRVLLGKQRGGTASKSRQRKAVEAVSTR
jgi:predicted ferric reductase